MHNSKISNNGLITKLTFLGRDIEKTSAYYDTTICVVNLPLTLNGRNLYINLNS